MIVPAFFLLTFSLHLPVSQYEAEILLHTLSKYSHEGHSRSLVEMYFLLPFYLRLLSFNVNLGMSSLHTKMTALVCVESFALEFSFIACVPQRQCTKMQGRGGPFILHSL